MPKYFTDPAKPGIIRWNDDETAGALVGMKAAEWVRILNAHDDMLAALKPFAIHVGAVSLSKALSHITREDLLRARDAFQQTPPQEKP